MTRWGELFRPTQINQKAKAGNAAKRKRRDNAVSLRITDFGFEGE